MIHIAHIINPVFADHTSDLKTAQPVTFETMRIAKKYAQDDMHVSLFTAQYPEDNKIIPEYFKRTKDLDKSVLDFGDFKTKRKLPLIKDILDRLYEISSESDYLIYSNADIALMPYFFKYVKRMIEHGYDAFVINRRTISKRNTLIDDIPFMFSEIGETHPGHDCFIFERSIYPKFKLGTTCVGVNWVGRVLICNLAIHANKFTEVKEEHLTFHLGDDKPWKNKINLEYSEHNKKETINILKEFEYRYGSENLKRNILTYLDGITMIKNLEEDNNKPEHSIPLNLLKKLNRTIKSLRRYSIRDK